MTGLLKKACEIGVLCGVDVSLAFSDLKGDLHIYSNSNQLKIMAKPKFRSQGSRLVYQHVKEEVMQI